MVRWFGRKVGGEQFWVAKSLIVNNAFPIWVANK